MQNGLLISTSRKLTQLLVVAVLLTCTSSCRSDQINARRDSCVNSASNMCLVPFQALFSGRSELVGERVSVSGYLRGDGQVFILFQGGEFATYGLKEGAVLLQGDAFMEQLRALDKTQVIVNGVLAPSDEYWLSLQLDSPPVEAPHVSNHFEEAPPRPSETRPN